MRWTAATLGENHKETETGGKDAEGSCKAGKDTVDKGKNQRERMESLALEPERKPDGRGDTERSIATSEKGAKSSKEPISLGN